MNRIVFLMIIMMFFSGCKATTIDEVAGDTLLTNIDDESELVMHAEYIPKQTEKIYENQILQGSNEMEEFKTRRLSNIEITPRDMVYPVENNEYKTYELMNEYVRYWNVAERTFKTDWEFMMLANCYFLENDELLELISGFVDYVESAEFINPENGKERAKYDDFMEKYDLTTYDEVSNYDVGEFYESPFNRYEFLLDNKLFKRYINIYESCSKIKKDEIDYLCEVTIFENAIDKRGVYSNEEAEEVIGQMEDFLREIGYME